MPKRQDPVSNTNSHHKRLLFTLCLIVLLTACQPVSSPVPSVTPSPTQAVTTVVPQPSITPTASPTPQPSATITPTKTEDCLSQGGELQMSSLPSSLLGEELDFYVYLPPCYHADPQSDYPVVILLHGLTYTYDQWVRLGLIDRMDELISSGEIPPAIIVLPWEKRFQSPRTSNYGEAIALELIPWIDQYYRTLPEAFYRGVGGLSRGASWAVRIGFSHADLFSRIGAHSLPTFENDIQQVQTWASQIPPENLPITLIDIGRNDGEVQSAFDFANQLDQYNIPHEFYLFNGGHTEDYWSSHLEFYLRWYTQDW